MAYRLISLFVLASQTLVFRFQFLPFLRTDINHIDNGFFPDTSSNLSIALIVFLLALFMNAASLLIDWQKLRKVNAWLLLLSSFYLTSHQYGFYVQAFVSYFWTSTLLLWLTYVHEFSMRKLLFLIKLLLSLVFLGGLMGKINAEYWSGEVFAYLNIPCYSENQSMSVFFSRSAILCEALIVLAVILPTRIAVILDLIILLSMWHTTHFKIFDAIGPLIGCASLIFIEISERFKHFAVNKIKALIGLALLILYLHFLLPALYPC